MTMETTSTPKLTPSATNGKKTPTRPKRPKRPKRPLSAYNLFYRYKRQLIVNSINLTGKGSNKEDISALIESPPGLEQKGDEQHQQQGDEDEQAKATSTLEHRAAVIRKALKSNLLPRETRTRYHRRSEMNGSVSFLEMGVLVRASWKSCDEHIINVFKDLAEEGRQVYRQRMKLYVLEMKQLGLNHKQKRSPNKEMQNDEEIDGASSDSDEQHPDGATTAKKKRKNDNSNKELALALALALDNNKNHYKKKIKEALLLDINEQKKKFQEAQLNMERSMAKLHAEQRNVMIEMSSRGGHTHTATAYPYETTKQHQAVVSCTPSSSGTTPPASPPSCIACSTLTTRVKQLEEQLVTERLKLRIRTLENDLAQQRLVETQMSKNHHYHQWVAPTSLLAPSSSGVSRSMPLHLVGALSAPPTSAAVTRTVPFTHKSNGSLEAHRTEIMSGCTPCIFKATETNTATGVLLLAQPKLFNNFSSLMKHYGKNGKKQREPLERKFIAKGLGTTDLQNGGARNTKYWVNATQAGLETAVVVFKMTRGGHTGKTVKVQAHFDD